MLCGGASFLDWIMNVSVGENPPLVWKIETLEHLVIQKVATTVKEQYDYAALRKEEKRLPSLMSPA